MRNEQSRNDDIDKTSRSFADIVRAIENVNFITPVEKFGRNSNRNATSQQQDRLLPRHDSFNTSPQINLNGSNEIQITQSQESNGKGALSEFNSPLISPADTNMFQKAVRKQRKNKSAHYKAPQFVLDAFDSEEEEEQLSFPNTTELNDDIKGQQEQIKQKSE